MFLEILEVDHKVVIESVEEGSYCLKEALCVIPSGILYHTQFRGVGHESQSCLQSYYGVCLPF